MNYIDELGKRAKAAAPFLASCDDKLKSLAMGEVARRLIEDPQPLIEVNKLDIQNARKNMMSESMIDRLTLNEERIESMAQGVMQVCGLPDPVGEIISSETRPNGLKIVKKRVPIGVIGIIYESRPNVTLDAAALCFKAGNAVILRGGSDAFNSNKYLVGLMRRTISDHNIPKDCIQMVEDTSRETAGAMMKADKYLDLLIPRGGGGLIRTVVENATVPVIHTGEGNCHVYIDESADLDMAVNIVNNAKTQRPSVCNAIESILVHEKIAAEFFKKLDECWKGKVNIIGDKATAENIKVIKIADEKDYASEFLSLKLSSKVVGSVDEAIEHINKYGTKHSECIVTRSKENAEKFQSMVDAAAVYVNASTRFTDGFEFGLGAEIGISTQKLHARGPMGLKEMTTYKYLIDGNGQIRG